MEKYRCEQELNENDAIQHVEDTDTTKDDRPPWEVIERCWVLDDTAILGRPLVKVPWVSEDRPAFNFRMAARRGMSSLKRLTSGQYDQFEKALKVYINKGFCDIVKDNSQDGYSQPPTATECQTVWKRLTDKGALKGTIVTMPRHFTPSHMVFREDHVTTPCRIVLDYREMNRYCFKGGKSQNDLLGVLLHVRGFKYVIGSDISKAFCQMVSSLEDLPHSGYTCIGPFTVLWYRVSFGSTAAPNMLEASSHDVGKEIVDMVGSLPPGEDSLVEANRLDDQKVFRALLRPTVDAVRYVKNGPAIPRKLVFEKFVDDFFFGGDTLEEVRSCREFVGHMFEGHGFVTDPLKDLVAAYGGVVGEEDKPDGHILGYSLVMATDALRALFSGNQPESKVTKRAACAILSSLYDPMGLFLELDFAGRFLWRDICKSCKEWSTYLDLPSVRRLKEWVNEVQKVTAEDSVQRYIDLGAEALLVCTDASVEAWGVDVRCTGEFVRYRLVARGGLYPPGQTSWSIPRKELVALHRGLQFVRSVSSYLPMKMVQGLHESEVRPLTPSYTPKQVTLLCDSEITVYRLRRPANDKKLPAPERRRLAEVREMCKELDVIVRHVPTQLNLADSISRGNYGMTKSIKHHEVLASLLSSSVVYDYREATQEGDMEVNCINSERLYGVTVVNSDGIDVPDLDGLEGDEYEELIELQRYARPNGRVGEGLLNDEDFTTCLRRCVKRCQVSDEDLRQFREYLLKRLKRSELGIRAKVMHRMSKICYIDNDGLVHRRPSSEDEGVREQGRGVVYLGQSEFSEKFIRLLAVVYHYVYTHLGSRRLCRKLKMKYYRKGMDRLVKKTVASCIPCLRARTARMLDYVNSQVQQLVVGGLWQVVGADIAGPYNEDCEANDEVEKYLLLVHDHVSGFTCVRPLRSCKPKTVALGLDSIFCEHGSPRVLLTDNDRVHFIRKDVKLTLAKHGVKYYTLPGYSQYLSFWERPHKDFVEVTRATRASGSAMVDRGSYIEDYMLAVRAYNVTPRIWCNVSPAELHFTYGVRLPGERGELVDCVDWDSLRLKYIDTDVVEFVRDNLPVLESARESIAASLAEYMDCWRLKQEANFERMAMDGQRDYSPRLYDVVFVSRSPEVRIGHHLDVIWSGPYTISSLKGTATVGVVKGVLLPYFGGVKESDDGQSLVVPIVYGEEEVFSLKNVKHAGALQEVIYAHLAKGRRVYVDADGTIQTLELKDGCEQESDGQRIREARTRTAVERGLAAWRRQVERGRVRDSDEEGIVDDHDNDVVSAEEDHVNVDDAVEDYYSGDHEYSSAPALPPGVRGDTLNVHGDHKMSTSPIPETPLEEDNSSEEGGLEGSVEVDLRFLRERLGVSKSLRFGRFLESLPPEYSMVLVVHESYKGLAKVLEGYCDANNGSIEDVGLREALVIDMDKKDDSRLDESLEYYSDIA
ncbi:gag/pol/env polyprotein, putative [Perkinsus marinus ATCC 50983]|uniref:Gag/pol/env polyprotein, putative n=1 Tax=Perkinsus marinus (strain ATCC 50983 / TXsc) TaxID=423536 RepID=C5K6F4_PERM5|nr:gag/pol/env polyprotein, putative [Perkinsus marinus ATCC 50983]EER19874.1 gag/pol/env polyprotein, putative [Perkinsus marinus ATCC 50983]|eukprot:XP_002788078.1 gag/pol/env polyprotein, putative [Perkinsus marinus ATCC 50983]